MRNPPRLRRLKSTACVVLALVAPPLTHAQVTVSFPEKHNVVTLHVPGKSAALQVDLLHLKLEWNQISQDLTARRLLASDGRGWTFSAFVHGGEGKVADAKGVRDREWKQVQKSPLKETQVKLYERGPMAMLEYMVEEFQGRTVHSKHVHGYLLSGDLWLDMHVSKGQFQPEDEKFLSRIRDGVKLVEPYEFTSREHFGYGSMFYLEQKWKQAATHYEAALALEKQNRVLPRDEWRVLVDNLGMAYGMSGNMAKAKTIFEYGLSQEPTYPMFHYNLACAHAEMGDVENALKSLGTAFQYKHNSIRGEEGMPDPRQDSSFKALLANEKFQVLSKSVCPASRKTPRGFICQP